jgi:hypothetical protein
MCTAVLPMYCIYRRRAKMIEEEFKEKELKVLQDQLKEINIEENKLKNEIIELDKQHTNIVNELVASGELKIEN